MWCLAKDASLFHFIAQKLAMLHPLGLMTTLTGLNHSLPAAESITPQNSFAMLQVLSDSIFLLSRNIFSGTR